MKVIIACLNSKYVHALLSPWCLLAGVREFAKGEYDIAVMESTINGDIQAFADKIASERPDIVAFSCYIWNITKTLEICKSVKEKCGCVIVLGGPEVAYRPGEMLEQYSFTDYVLSGEGEWAFSDFLDSINGDLSSVAGLTYRENGVIKTVPYGDTLSLNVDSFDNSISIELAVDSAEYFDIKTVDAEKTVKEILSAVKVNWEQLAAKYGISREQVEEMRPAFDVCYRN